MTAGHAKRHVVMQWAKAKSEDELYSTSRYNAKMHVSLHYSITTTALSVMYFCGYSKLHLSQDGVSRGQGQGDSNLSNG